MDITENVTRTPLYGHTSPETAYVVGGYPYGFRLRCTIRYWLEHNRKRGFRFVSQTTNPKAAGERWNAPKRSTYALLSAAMYLDGEGHVQWAGLTEYADAAEVARFAESFPGADLAAARVMAQLRARYYRARLDAAGEAEDVPAAERARVTLAGWRSAAEALLSAHLVRDHGWSNTLGATLSDLQAMHKVAHQHDGEEGF